MMPAVTYEELLNKMFASISCKDILGTLDDNSITTETEPPTKPQQRFAPILVDTDVVKAHSKANKRRHCLLHKSLGRMEQEYDGACCSDSTSRINGSLNSPVLAHTLVLGVYRKAEYWCVASCATCDKAEDQKLIFFFFKDASFADFFMHLLMLK